MRPLSPSKLCPHPADPVGEWWRLARTSDGVLCLESISDGTLNRPGSAADWAYGGDVPHPIARQLTDDEDPDQVAQVLDRARLALGYDRLAATAIDHDAGAVGRHLAAQHIAVALSPSLADPVDDPTLRAIAAETVAIDVVTPTDLDWTFPPCEHFAGGRNQPDAGPAAVMLAGRILARQGHAERLIAEARDQGDVDTIKLANELEHARDAVALAKLVIECARKGIKL